ncbi:MAG: HK97 family phage prohead protease [Croceibacterium sp.]
MEYAGSTLEIKELGQTGAIEGLLAGFGDVDHGGDRLAPGCLTKSLAARTTPLPMLLCHDHKKPIGSWHEWQEQADGLYVKGTLALETRDAQEAHALAKSGALTGLSIGWKPRDGMIDRKSGVRNITSADLHEGSLVPCPMHGRTRITSIKEICGARDLEEMFREFGHSGRKAKHAASAAWKALNDNSDDTAELAELAAIIGKSAARLSTLERK